MKSKLHDRPAPDLPGANPAESSDGNRRKWLESLEHVLEHALKTQGPDQTPFFVDSLMDRLRTAGLRVPTTVSTPYVNTIPVEEQPPFPGDWQTEVRIKSYIRWNAMAMVV
ncbi:MAG: pyruvate dehydrogenase (acetyl-transferring), homodimeric type, partial [Verrucomicrobia bacterium]